ncbi:MAG: pilus assembly protein TadG-related protein [Blastocatellia bacterium]
MAVAAIGMFSFLLIAGLAIDIGRLYLVGAELQNAADATAISAASSLNSGASGIQEAVNRAVAPMNNYEFLMLTDFVVGEKGLKSLG